MIYENEELRLRTININAEVESNDGDGKHNRVNTRDELERYDPGLFKIVSEYFPETNERISCHQTVNRFNFEKL